jgi:hypothetical protein
VLVEEGEDTELDDDVETVEVLVGGTVVLVVTVEDGLVAKYTPAPAIIKITTITRTITILPTAILGDENGCIESHRRNVRYKILVADCALEVTSLSIPPLGRYEMRV